MDGALKKTPLYMGTVSVFHMIRVEEAYVLNTGKYLFITYTKQNFNILLIRRGKNGTLFAVDVFRLCWYVTVIQLIAFDEGERLLLESLFPAGFTLYRGYRSGCHMISRFGRHLG